MKDTFDCLWDVLKPEDNISWEESDDVARQRDRGGEPPFILDLRDQLLLVLMRLRLNLLEQDLAIRFGFAMVTVSRTFNHWINYLYLRLNSLH